MRKNKDVVASMFLPAAMVMIFTQLTGVISGFIDGVVTSRYLGSDPYSAISLFGPLVSIVLLAASFISIGGQIVCSQKMGTGQRDEANAVFSFSLVFGLLIGALFVLLSIASPGTLFLVCGVSLSKRPELYGYMLEYLRGYIIGVPALVMVQVLSPFLVMDNGKRLVTTASVVLCVANITGDLLNVLVFHGGIFGIGAATSIAVWLQLGVLLIHCVGKAGYFRFSLKALTGTHLRDIVKNGSISFVKRLASVLRDIATNHFNLMVAVSTAAIAAKGMQGDVNSLVFCFSVGIGRALLPISSMFYGASDKEGLKRVFACAMKLAVEVTLAIGAVLFFAAPLVTKLYTADPQVTALAVFSLRCTALGLSLDAVSEVIQYYLQSTENRTAANVLCFAERLFIPVPLAFALGKLFGSRGILASTSVGKAVMLLILFIYLCVRNKGIPRRIEDYMFLRPGFGGKAEDNLNASITTMDDVMRESRRTEEFCLGHGMDAHHRRLMALFVEEMAGNIISHGKSREKDGVCADFRLFADGESICLSLRDYCKGFDPMKYYELHRQDRDDANLGIRMVMNLAKDIRYINTYNSNFLFIRMCLNSNHQNECVKETLIK